MDNEKPKTAVAYYYGRSIWGIEGEKRSMGSDGYYEPGHYYVLYTPHFIINAVPY